MFSVDKMVELFNSLKFSLLWLESLDVLNLLIIQPQSSIRCSPNRDAKT